MANPTGKGGFQERPQDINLEGAPKRGQSWQETTKRITNMTRDELVAYVGGKRTRIGKLLASATSEIPVKDAMVIAAVVAFLIDPNPRMLQALSDREDGKPNQPISGKDGEPLVIQVELKKKEDS
jgi:hypothetical protein